MLAILGPGLISDASGLVSNPQAVRLPTGVAPTRQLYGILVGNDVYSDRRLTLRYARHDAERLGAVLQSNPGHSYARSSIKLLTDAAATPEAVRAEISRPWKRPRDRTLSCSRLRAMASRTGRTAATI